MSSIFDSTVYSLRKSAPFTTPDLLRFIKSVFEDGADEVSLTLRHRHAVASRAWWSLKWQQHGLNCEVSSQEYSLCMWRAVQLWKNVEREHELESVVNNRHGCQCLFGWIDGDGI